MTNYLNLGLRAPNKVKCALKRGFNLGLRQSHIDLSDFTKKSSERELVCDCYDYSSKGVLSIGV